MNFRCVSGQGTETLGRIPKEALLQLEVVAGSLVGGRSCYGPLAFESIEAAQEQLYFQLAAGMHAGASGFAAAARLRKMTDEVSTISAERPRFPSIVPSQSHCSISILPSRSGHQGCPVSPPRELSY